MGLDGGELAAVASGGGARTVALPMEWVRGVDDEVLGTAGVEVVSVEGPDEVLEVAGRLPGELFGVMGPLTWVPIGDDHLPAASSCERGLFDGGAVASSGPILELWVAPGGTPGEYGSVVKVSRRGEEQGGVLSLYLDGEVVGRSVDGSPISLLLPSGGVVVATLEAQDGWAVTSPNHVP